MHFINQVFSSVKKNATFANTLRNLASENNINSK